MTTPFKILYDEYGRTGNRFFAYLEPIAWAICKQKRVVILFPEKILQHYDKLRNSSCVRLPLWGKGKLWWRIARKVFYYNHLAQAFYKTRLSEKLGFYAEWQDDILREPHEYWPKVKPQIQQLFTPNDDIKLPIDELFKKVKSGGCASLAYISAARTTRRPMAVSTTTRTRSSSATCSRCSGWCRAAGSASPPRRASRLAMRSSSTSWPTPCPMPQATSTPSRSATTSSARRPHSTPGPLS